MGLGDLVLVLVLGLILLVRDTVQGSVHVVLGLSWSLGDTASCSACCLWSLLLVINLEAFTVLVQTVGKHLSLAASSGDLLSLLVCVDVPAAHF